jgi:PAS domain S-box-containing protein
LNNPPLQTDLFLMQLLDASVEGILAFDRDCRYIAWNQAMERISGLKREDVLGRCAFDVFPFLKETGEDKCFYAALAGENSTSENRPYTVPKTGREGFFQGHYSPLLSPQNEVIGGIAVVHDITERRRAEEAAQGAHQQLAFHVENSPLAVIEWDSDFRVSRWSESAERLFGWKAREVIGKHVRDWHFVFDEDVDAVEQVTNRQRMGAELLGVQRNRNYTKRGSVLYCEWYNSVLHDHSGKLVSVLSLVLDVTARKLAGDERAASLARERDARKQAEEADRLKDEFLATLSHELRTPLTSILGWATLIRNGEIDKEANLERALETIERNARSQARLIDDLLDVSRIITGNLRLDVRPVDVAPILEAGKDALRPAANAKSIEIEMEFDSASCLVSADPNRLRQVIWNLLSNAIKFTPRGGSVSVRLQRAGDHARLTVTDTGEGITPEFLPYVFHRFRQEESSISRKAGGLGLGLAVVRHLVELHGGKVSAESRGPGQGSSFTVDLPLATDRRDARRDVLGSGDRQDLTERGKSGRIEGVGGGIGDEISAGLGSGESVNIENASTSADVGSGAGVGTSTRLDGLRVLLVEDDDDSRDLLGIMLKRHGAVVISASSSAEAMKRFAQEPPDVVISDIGMPDEDGYELIRRIRSLPSEWRIPAPTESEGRASARLEGRRRTDNDDSRITDHASLLTHNPSVPPDASVVPAIALTGYANNKDRERALAAGYQLHIAKPIEPADLVTAIATLIGRKHE